jgi:hypothetical protein
MSVLLRSPRHALAAITPQPAIAVAGLTKRYGDRQVLQGIDLEIRRGELVANFFIIEERPLLLRVVGAAFGVKHLNDALLTPLNPNASGSRIEWVDLLVILAWGLAALLVALRWFRWTAARREA